MPPAETVNNKDIQLSKSLSWLLRHGAVQEGLHLSSEGYIEINQILNHKSFKGKFNQCDIERVVKNNDKQRFKLRPNLVSHTLEIKANQGHSIPEVTDAELIPILEPKYNNVIHGTYFKCWPLIKQHGLSRMKRKHIHLAKGAVGDKAAISGLRRNAQLHIYINLAQALSEGLTFYESENGVILTSGNQKGYLETRLFSKVIIVSTGEQLYP